MTNEITHLLTSHQTEINQWLSSPSLRQHCELLEQIATALPNDDSDILFDNVATALDSVVACLFRNAYGSEEIPEQFWDTEIGETITRVRFWLFRHELVTISEAAALLGGNNQATRMRVQRMIKRGDLELFIDPAEQNPQRNKRVRVGELGYTSPVIE